MIEGIDRMIYECQNLTNIAIAFIEVNRWWARNAYHFKGQSTGKTSSLYRSDNSQVSQLGQ